MGTPLNPKKKPSNTYLRYSGIVFQMMAITALGAYLGIKLDESRNTSPIFTLCLTFLSIVLAIYLAAREATKER